MINILLPRELLVGILEKSTIVCLFVCTKWRDLCTDKKNDIVKTCPNIECERIITYGTSFAFSWKNYDSYWILYNEKCDRKNKALNFGTDAYMFSFCLYPHHHEPSGYQHMCQCRLSKLH